ncbi:flagellin domain protein [Pseudomonas synxantha BG33R]|uniref:flagellin N-terminal helical domain-containing protein n=1 Tax=Pseudomonas TaxID=286 RepID=UPI00025FFF39|nr:MULTISPECIES: flagellin [Pseudomonas]EIK71817.1 flagellin domain protein [Pseudomonas synxantha BG33R]MCK3828029.1 flagellin [Pseudomonas sp. W2Aug9]MCK3833424.1 flagellin [Pseudomonas fluorescens]QOY70088.1 flagellin [Pseudomonas sp. OST1909]RFD28122.1 flagellin [Pseudomonas sp. GL93]
MALSVNTNITSLGVQKNLNKASDALSQSMNRLSSGLKINSAKDDAAGMQIANRLNNQVKGLNVAIANANNGVSIAQTAEGAMQESTNTLQRLRELALQASNGDKSDADRVSLQQEFTAKVGELNRIASTTTFGGRNLLDGSFSNVAFQIGANANETISFGMTDISSTALKGNYKEAAVNGTAMTGLAATSTGSVLGGTKATVTGGAAALATVATDAFTINGTEITLGVAAAGAAAGTAAVTAINAQTATTGVTASADAAGVVTLTSKSAITLGASATGGATAGLAKLGLTAGATPATNSTPTGTTAMGLTGGISVNGTAVAWTATDTMADVLTDIAAAAGAGATATLVDGRVKVTSGGGQDIKLSNTSAGSLSQLGLSAGTSQAKLTADTSIDVNGVEVKFKKGDTADAIVSSINSASTGVQASKNADGTLNLFADKDITIKDGSAGTGLAALGLTAVAAAGTKTAVTMETSVSDLNILTAAASQQATQALDDAMQQIDSQRSQLGAVQNRFTSTVANLQSISQNSSAAKGRVEDADFASEAAELTKQQTLQQASTAILSQANQLPSAVLKLLQ